MSESPSTTATSDSFTGSLGGATLPVEERDLLAKDGTRLLARRVVAPGARRGRVLVIHGFAEHSGRYVHVLRGLAARGLEAWAVDLRGHGRSEGRRAFIEKFNDYLEDVQALVEAAAPDAASVPTFVLGHSMGGLVATRFVEERPGQLKGLVLSSPFYRVRMAVPAVKRAAASLLSHVVPWLSLPTELDPSLLARDPEVGRLYMADPLVTHHATTRWFTEITKVGQPDAFAKASSIQLPVLLVAGAADGIVDPDASRELYARLTTPDRTLKMWDGLRHEILNEPEKGQVFALMADWIEQRLAPKK